MHETEKALRDHGDKLSADTRREIETAVEDLKRVMAGDDPAAIKSGSEKLMQVSAKLGEEVYKAAQGAAGDAAGAGAAGAGAGGAGGAPGAGADAGARAGGSGGADGPGTVEAEYEVVDEDKDKS